MSPQAPASSSAVGKAAALRSLLCGRQRLLVLTHNNPDPDSLGGAVGLQCFAQQAAGVPSTFAVTGRIVRAENQEMVRQLGIEMAQLDALDLADYDCFALVDTQPGFGHTFVPPEVALDIVIDHHVCAEAQQRLVSVPFVDVRCDIGATSSLVAGYLMDCGVVPSRDVATALVYGIKTDTADLSRNVSAQDERAYDYVFARADRQKLVAITRPRLPPAYFQTLKDALDKVRIYDKLTLCSLGRVASAEMVAEVADLLQRMEGVQFVFCGGLVGNNYYVSVRTDANARDAWSLIRAAMEGETGTFGGHGAVAGGSIQLASGDARSLKRLERRLERNILRALGVAGANATGFKAHDD